MQSLEVPVHIDPDLVLHLAEKPQLVESAPDGTPLLEAVFLEDGRGVFLVHNFHENFANPAVQKALEKLTGYPAETLHQTVESVIPSPSPTGQKMGPALPGRKLHCRGGDKLILDQGMRDKNVESMVVGDLQLEGGESAEYALVRMYRYGALKQLVLPPGNPGNQIAWEMAYSLNGRLCFVIPRGVEDRDGRLVAKDNGCILELDPGDAVFLPLIPRQVISTDPEATQEQIKSGARYMTISPAWGGKEGASQTPVFWRSQIKT